MKKVQYEQSKCPQCRGVGYIIQGVDNDEVRCDHLVNEYTKREKFLMNVVYYPRVTMLDTKPNRSIIYDDDLIWVYDGVVIQQMTGKQARNEWSKSHAWCPEICLRLPEDLRNPRIKKKSKAS